MLAHHQRRSGSAHPGVSGPLPRSSRGRSCESGGGLAWKHDNVFIDTSAYAPLYYPAQLLQYLRTYDQDKVLFGTNFPQLRLDKCMEQVQALALPPKIERKFLFENARAVFKLGLAAAGA